MCSRAAWAMKKAPDRLTAITRCQSSSPIFATVLSIVMPALLTRMSSRPCRSMTSPTTPRQSPAEPMLPSCTVNGRPGYRSARPAWNCAALSWCRQYPAATAAPAPASCLLIAAPMPAVPPVTRATRPVRVPSVPVCRSWVIVIGRHFLPALGSLVPSTIRARRAAGQGDERPPLQGRWPLKAGRSSWSAETARQCAGASHQRPEGERTRP